MVAVTDALTSFLTGIVDYAGLFPPASLDMPSAVKAYAEYLHHPSSTMLGRFVVPVARLQEFGEAAHPFLPRGETSTPPNPWILSVLIGPDATADIQESLKFNCRHWSGSELGHAMIDSVEIKASSIAEIGASMSRMPKQFRPFFEIPLDSDPAPLIAEIKRTGACAKIRTGGVTPEAFPSPSEVARFIKRCQEASVPFKATAGLHHPIRGPYTLTYAPHAPHGTMFGYLNVFLSAAFAWNGADEPFLLQLLEERDPSTFTINEYGLSYHGATLPHSALRAAREQFALSFGSCSFLEPVEELATLPFA